MNRLTRKTNQYDDTDYGYVRNYEDTELPEIMEKLGELEDIEEQLGCPLDVVFKALTNGFKFIVSSHKLGTLNQIVNQMIYCDYAYLYYANDVNAWCIATIHDCFYLKDYKKTWWLKEDKSE